MKQADKKTSSDSEQAIKQLLQAERDAEQSIRNCEDEAHQIIREAHIRAKEIQSRTDRRITNMEMRHGHKLNQLIKSMERQGEVDLKQDISHNYADEDLQAVIEQLAVELYQHDPSAPKIDEDQ